MRQRHVEHVSVSMSFNRVISHAAHQTCRSHDQIWKVKSGHDSRTMQTVSSYVLQYRHVPSLNHIMLNMLRITISMSFSLVISYASDLRMIT